MAVLSLLSILEAQQLHSWKKPFHEEWLIVQVPANKGTSAYYGQCQPSSSGWCELTLQTVAFFLQVKFLQVTHVAFAPVDVARNKSI